MRDETLLRVDESKQNPSAIERSFMVAENAWTLTVMSVIAGFVGLFVDGRWFCLFCIPFAFGIHRSNGLKGLTRIKQVSVCAAILICFSAICWWVGIKVNQSREHIPTVQEIGDYLSKTLNTKDVSSLGPPAPVPSVPNPSKPANQGSHPAKTPTPDKPTSHQALQLPPTERTRPPASPPQSSPATSSTPDDLGDVISCPRNGTLARNWGLIDKGNKWTIRIGVKDGVVPPALGDSLNLGMEREIDAKRSANADSLLAEIDSKFPATNPIGTAYGKPNQEKIQSVEHILGDATIVWNYVVVSGSVRLGPQKNAVQAIEVHTLTDESQIIVADFDEFANYTSDARCLQVLYELSTKQP